MSLKRLPCFTHVNWNPGPKALREFSLSMLVGFGLIGLVVAWRHGGIGTASYVLFAAGLLLAVSGTIPGLGRRVYVAVYVVSGILGLLLSQVILTLIFLLVFVPIALLLRIMGMDLLRLRAPAGRSLWVRRSPEESTDRYYRQF